MTRGKMITDSLILLSVAAVLVLGGCVSSGTNGGAVVVAPTPVVTPPMTKAQELIIDIREYAELGCKFVPAATFLTNLLGQSGGVFNTAQEYADAICDVVKGRASRRRGAGAVYGYVNGVPIQGVFVR
jgi:hypothetical protein